MTEMILSFHKLNGKLFNAELDGCVNQIQFFNIFI